MGTFLQVGAHRVLPSSSPNPSLSPSHARQQAQLQQGWRCRGGLISSSDGTFRWRWHSGSAHTSRDQNPGGSSTIEAYESIKQEQFHVYVSHQPLPHPWCLHPTNPIPVSPSHQGHPSAFWSWATTPGCLPCAETNPALCLHPRTTPLCCYLERPRKTRSFCHLHSDPTL